MSALAGHLSCIRSEVTMRLSLSLLGWTFDLSLEPDTSDDDDKARDLSGGTTSSLQTGFTPQWGDQRWQPGGEP